MQVPKFRFAGFGEISRKTSVLVPVALVLTTLSAIALTLAWPEFSPKAKTITLPLYEDRRVDLTRLGNDWDRVCVLAPYSSNERAREVLGIDLDIEASSAVWYMDNMVLLVVMSPDRPPRLFDVLRVPADFLELSGECLPRGAIFRAEARGVVRVE